MSSQDFSERLRETMAAQNVTIFGLSRATNIPERTINRYRAGVSEPRDAHGEPTDNAHALCKALNVDVDWLLDSPRELAS